MLPNPTAPYVRVERGEIVVQQSVIPIDSGVMFRSASAKMVARFLVTIPNVTPIWAQSAMKSLKYGWPMPSARVDIEAFIPQERDALIRSRATSRPG